MPSGQSNESSSGGDLDLGSNLQELETDLAHRAYSQIGAVEHAPDLRQKDEGNGVKK